MENKKIIIKNIVINYKESGIGIPLIFLHGWGQSSDCFVEHIKQLSPTNHIYALDLPGFGDTDEPSYAYDIYDYEKILEEFIEKLNITNPIIIGHSFGGRIALIYASKNNNISKLVLTGCAGIKPSHSIKYYLKIYHYKFMKLLTKTPLYIQYHDDLVNNSGSEDYKKSSSIKKQILIKVVNEDLTYCLKNITIPTILYWGQKDLETPLKDGKLMSELIPNSKLIINENGDHFAFLTAKEEFIKIIKEVL